MDLSKLIGSVAGSISGSMVVALICYAMASLGILYSLIKDSTMMKRISIGLLCFGIFCQVFSVLLPWEQLWQMSYEPYAAQKTFWKAPWLNISGTLNLFSLALILTYLLPTLMYPFSINRNLKVGLVVIWISILSLLLSFQLQLGELRPVVDSLNLTTLVAKIPIASVGLAFFILASCSAAFNILMKKSKEDQWTIYYAVRGIPFLTIGLLLNMLWTHQLSGVLWSWSDQEILLMTVLLINLIYLFLRQGGQTYFSNWRLELLPVFNLFPIILVVRTLWPGGF